jgi:ABC-2 type transport system ATP-binding protein
VKNLNLDPALLVLLVPLAVIELGLMVFALWDLTRPGRQVRGGSRLVWALVILFVNFIGPIIYFVAGREEAVDETELPAAPLPGARPGWVAPGSPARGTTPASAAPASPATAVAPAPAPVAPAAVAPPPVATMPARAPAPVEQPLSASVAPAAVDAGPATTEPPPAAIVAAARVDPFSLPGAPVRDVPVRRPPAPGEAAIVTEALTKRFGSGASSVLALDQLELSVPAGSVFGLLGPNGAGKTTCLRILSGLAHPTAGAATVAGVRLGGDGTRLQRRIGYLDQDPRYYGWMTGRELVTMVGRLQGIEGYRVERRAMEVLEQVGLAGAADRRIGTYSGGMRQRLGIAQAMVNRPTLLILDEPVSSLDPEGRRDLLTLIAELRGTSTVLFSTHVLADVERICDRVAILDRGHLVTEGPLDALLDRYALPIYRLEPEPGQEAAVAGLVERLRGMEWVTDVAVEHGLVRVTVTDPARAAHGLLPAVVEAGVALATFERARPTLEDVFLELVGRDRPEAVA